MRYKKVPSIRKPKPEPKKLNLPIIYCSAEQKPVIEKMWEDALRSVMKG